MHAPHQQTHLTHDPNFNLDDTRHQPTSQAIDTSHMNHTHIGWADQHQQDRTSLGSLELAFLACLTPLAG